MDDGPRTGALQLLILCACAPAAYLAIIVGASTSAIIPGLIALLGLYAILRLELYARRRSREEAEARERRLREARMPRDPFA